MAKKENVEGKPMFTFEKDVAIKLDAGKYHDIGELRSALDCKIARLGLSTLINSVAVSLAEIADEVKNETDKDPILPLINDMFKALATEAAEYDDLFDCGETPEPEPEPEPEPKKKAPAVAKKGKKSTKTGTRGVE